MSSIDTSRSSANTHKESPASTVYEEASAEYATVVDTAATAPNANNFSRHYSSK